MTVSLDKLLPSVHLSSLSFRAGGVGVEVCGSGRAGGASAASSRPYVCTAPLEADVVADLAGGARAGLRQEQPTVGANANLVDGLAGPGGRGAAGGLPFGQPHQANPASVQRDL